MATVEEAVDVLSQLEFPRQQRNERSALTLLALLEHDVRRDWLVLIEAVTSHGPVNPKRREELRCLFSASSAGLVFVTAFENRRTLAKYVADISWETEVWVAEDPTHLIHFDGERFLGPYQD